MKLKVGNKTLTVRKWKGKDKKKFINALKRTRVSEQDVMDSLVYDCIEEDVVLSNEEYRYVVSRIRAMSLGEEFNVEFYCKECGETYSKTFMLKDILTYTYKDLKEINVQNTKIKFGDIKNKEFYVQKINEDINYDFLLRIEKFNNNDSFTLEELEEMVEDLDLDVLEEIMTKYHESKFTVHDVHSVECTNCGHSQKYKFDDIPGFFPKSWF